MDSVFLCFTDSLLSKEINVLKVKFNILISKVKTREAINDNFVRYLKHCLH